MTYAGLAAAFLLAPAALVVTAVVLARPGRAWWAATAVVLALLMLLTAVFDSLMIAADLFRFDQERLLGIRVGRAPLEDLAWPVASALGLPALWLLLGRRGARASDGGDRGPRDRP